MSALRPTTIPARAAQMAWQRVGGELVLLAIEGKQLFGLNEVAARVWDLVDDARDLGAICAVVAAEFSVDVATAERDVRQFLAQLLERGAITLREPAHTSDEERARER